MPSKNVKKTTDKKDDKHVKVKKAPELKLRRPKGMRDIRDMDFFKYQGFFEHAAEIALYYGFAPIETPTVEHEDVFKSGIGAETDVVTKEMYTVKSSGRSSFALRPEGTAGVVRAYVENGWHTLPQPIKVYYFGSFFRHDRPQRGRHREFKQFGLEVLGSEKSISDAMIITIVCKILEEADCKDVVVHINSLGDMDSRVAYTKALTAYYKKHINKLPDDARETVQTNPLRLLDSKVPEIIDLNKEAPEPIGSLTAPSKQHFKEVLEYLETLGIEYVVSPRLVRGLDYYRHTVFEIFETKEEGDTEPPLAIAGGGRYDGLAEQLGSKRPIPAVGAAIGVDRVLLSCEGTSLIPRILREPKVFFIHLGFEAKLHSLKITEILRKAGVPIQHSLSKDSLGAQLSGAEKSNIPYAIILGQKEVMEKTVIVRNMKKHSQEVVAVDDLLAYAKKKLR
ncbi:MAG: histidine--tRNA ligase [bacterium]|nr:histidine--tRNA ligase [bacterium]